MCPREGWEWQVFKTLPRAGKADDVITKKEGEFLSEIRQEAEDDFQFSSPGEHGNAKLFHHITTNIIIES